MIIVRTLKKDPCINTYLDKYGPHFNEKLCNFATSLMHNDKNMIALTKNLIDTILLKYPHNFEENVMYDYVFIYNMGRMDFLLSSIIDESHLVMYVLDVLLDKDAYDGYIFYRWIADMKGKEIEVNWEDVI